MRRAIAVLVLVTGVTAFAEARWGLRWRAPEDCITPAELSQAAEERLGRSVFGAKAQLRVDGVMQRAATAPRWRAKFTVVDDTGSVVGSRELTGDDSSCRALDSKLAVVLALIIDPNALGKPSPPEASGPPGPSAAPPQTVPSAEDGVFVHLEVNDKRVRLFRLLGSSYGSFATTTGQGSVEVTTFNDECGAPCDVVIKRPGDRFFIGGEGITMSKELALSGQGAALDLKVDPGSSLLRWGGVLSLGAGLGAVVTGVVFLILGSSSGRTDSFLGQPVQIGLIAGGAAVTAASIPMLMFSSTKVEIAPRPAQPSRVLNASR